MNTFQNDLKSFVEKVIPEGAPDIQVQEMRKAFVAGAKAAAHHAVYDEDFIEYADDIDDMFEFITDGRTA